MYAICVRARAEKGKASKCLYPSWSQLPLRRTSYKRILLLYALNILEGCWFTLLGALHDAKTSSTIAVLQHFGSRKLCANKSCPKDLRFTRNKLDSRYLFFGSHKKLSIFWIVLRVWEGPRSNLGEYHRSHRWGTQKTSNDFETERNRQPDKYLYRSR